MTWAPSAAASRANCSCFAIIDSLSPVHVVWVMAARTVVIGFLSELAEPGRADGRCVGAQDERPLGQSARLLL